MLKSRINTVSLEVWSLFSFSSHILRISASWQLHSHALLCSLRVLLQFAHYSSFNSTLPHLNPGGRRPQIWPENQPLSSFVLLVLSVTWWVGRSYSGVLNEVRA